MADGEHVTIRVHLGSSRDVFAGLCRAQLTQNHLLELCNRICI